MKIAREKLIYAKIWSLLEVKTRIRRSKTIQDIPNTNEIVKMRDLERLDWKKYARRLLKRR